MAGKGSRIDIRVGNGVEASIRKQVQDAIKSPDVLKPAAEITLKEIKLKITQAKEPATDKPFQNPTIGNDWKKRKQKLSSTNTPFDAASGGGTKKARLIFTGQFIKSIKYFLSPGRIVIRPDGDHQPYKNLDGSRSGESMKNETLGQYLINQGRNWAGFPEKVRERIAQAIRNQIRRELTKRKK